ncbi:Transcription factor, fungi [Penicillium italicum]|uniref:Transcription factor, fungi n=1 Tax=Penicillium italicum TaxID=40296 RepID=A0A0A2KUH0_PENIT|nr:Transcription factor, fungi [Penicillium italicum]
MASEKGTAPAVSAAPSSAPARARASCSRCHKRKKRCDRTLPSCKNCVSARVRCSFEDDDLQTASYPIVYVQGLEEKLRRLGRALAAQKQNTPQAAEATPVLNHNHLYTDFEMPEMEMVDPECSPQGVDGREVGNESSLADNTPGLIQGPLVTPRTTPRDQTSTFGQQLTALSLEATAERHLGSTTGLSFANLTQMILRRLTPDKADFVFNSHQNSTTRIDLLDLGSPSDPFNDSFFQRLSESISSYSLIFGDLLFTDLAGSGAALDSLSWPSDETHVRRLVDFYFSHSHTLYPILYRCEVMDTIEKIHQNPQNLATQTPLHAFRIWMVLAIGSTAYSSVTLTEESESMLFYNKALQYSEQALGGDEMVGKPAHGFITAERATDESLVYPGSHNAPKADTWFLVGTAARLALGMGLHAASSYRKFPLNVQQRRKRIFFSIYMMDRVVSITLGRPFALHDDDIDVTPFEDADDEFIHSDCISPQSPLQPSLMAVPLHILSLRRIAGKISRQVYGNVKDSNSTLEEREAIIASLHQELLDWRRSMPFPLPDVNDSVPHLSTTWYDFNYYTHLAMIYRPSPLCPVSNLKRIKTLEMAASMSLRQAFSMHQQQRFAYNWLNFLALFTATLSLVYAITAQPDDLSTVLRNTRAIADLDLATQLFETLGLKFLAAKEIQDMTAKISRRYKEVRALKDPEPNMGY